MTIAAFNTQRASFKAIFVLFHICICTSWSARHSYCSGWSSTKRCRCSCYGSPLLRHSLGRPTKSKEKDRISIRQRTQFASCSVRINIDSSTWSFSLDKLTVEWLYKPCELNCKANWDLPVWSFLLFARLFWNQILICDSFNSSLRLSSRRFSSFRYLRKEKGRLVDCLCGAESF